jgi:hypothetical protein
LADIFKKNNSCQSCCVELQDSHDFLFKSLAFDNTAILKKMIYLIKKVIKTLYSSGFQKENTKNDMLFPLSVSIRTQ